MTGGGRRPRYLTQGVISPTSNNPPIQAESAPDLGTFLPRILKKLLKSETNL